MFATANRYSSLNIDDDATGHTSLHTQSNFGINSQTPEMNNEIKMKLPPPIFIREVLDFVSFRQQSISLISPENFLFKSSTNALKVQTTNPDSYRKTIHFLREEKAQFHSFQLQEDKAFRIVIRNLHPSTPTTDVGIAIEDLGFTVRRIVNVLQKIRVKSFVLAHYISVFYDAIKSPISIPIRNTNFDYTEYNSDNKSDGDNEEKCSHITAVDKYCVVCVFNFLVKYNLYSNAYPGLYDCYKLLLTLSVTQSTVSQDFLENFMLMSIEIELLNIIDLTKVLKFNIGSRINHTMFWKSLTPHPTKPTVL
ncbi:Manganese/iron superoxide dismutase, N-terminal [Cinara cedri]|uniref:Manganese/iron superoxide dismutase, N-terminal n=1 Tax=Cinara cedri TaxID=506608 RepID=A0A5E4MN26_9HEMI|nr:Manganese/iron superoxide dismutase, N-terminal [Cinara cedri]